MTGRIIDIPARRGIGVRLSRGQCAAVINTHGTQVVDTWAFGEADIGEFMSMEHTRASCRRLVPLPGQPFLTNRRRPILTLMSDMSAGAHDSLIAACDQERYRLLGHDGRHDNCTDNLHQALAQAGRRSPVVPCPLNLFMNIAVGPEMALEWREPLSEPGDIVEVRAEMDCLLVFSACPMDILPINGRDRVPRGAQVRIADR